MNKYPSGVLRGTLVFLAGSILSILIGIAAGQSIGALWGVIIGIIIFIISVVVTVVIVNNSKTLTIVDCVLPIVISLIAAFMFSPIALMHNALPESHERAVMSAACASNLEP
jgi:hypothetical protein